MKNEKNSKFVKLYVTGASGMAGTELSLNTTLSRRGSKHRVSESQTARKCNNVVQIINACFKILTRCTFQSCIV